MVGNAAKKAVAAALSGAMALSAAAPFAMAEKGYVTYGSTNKVKSSSTTPTEFDYWDRIGGSDRYGTMKKIVDASGRSKEKEFVEWKSFAFRLTAAGTNAGYTQSWIDDKKLNDKYVLVDEALYKDLTGRWAPAGTTSVYQDVYDALNLAKYDLDVVKLTALGEAYVDYSNAITTLENAEAAYAAAVAERDAAEYALWTLLANSDLQGIISQIQPAADARDDALNDWIAAQAAADAALQAALAGTGSYTAFETAQDKANLAWEAYMDAVDYFDSLWATLANAMALNVQPQDIIDAFEAVIALDLVVDAIDEAVDVAILDVEAAYLAVKAAAADYVAAGLRVEDAFVVLAGLLEYKDTVDFVAWLDWYGARSKDIPSYYGIDNDKDIFIPATSMGGYYAPFWYACMSDLFVPGHVYGYYTAKNSEYQFTAFKIDTVEYDDLWASRSAVIATGDNFPDALSANGLAGSLGIPLILTRSKALSDEAKDLIKTHKITKLYVMGGEAAISSEVREALKGLNVALISVAGDDRQATSLEALKLTTTTDQVIVCTGTTFADALSIGPLAYRYGIPIILTGKDGKLSDEASAYLKANKANIQNVIIIGGEAVVSDDVTAQIGLGPSYWRIAGEDRYDTSIKVAQFLVQGSYYDYIDGKWQAGDEDVLYDAWTTYGGFSYDSIYVATGENFPDALAGAQLAAGAKARGRWETFGSPIVLTKNGNTGRITSWLKANYNIKRDGYYGFLVEDMRWWEKTSPAWELDTPTYEGGSYEIYTDAYGRTQIRITGAPTVTKYGHVFGLEAALNNETVNALNKAVKDIKND